MRLRSLVIPAVLAFAATVVAPAHAQAAVECGLIVPSKVVIDAPAIETDMRLTSGCYANRADRAAWRLVLTDIELDADDGVELTDGPDFVRVWPDDAPMGMWAWRPAGAARADGATLTQNWTRTEVRYASKLTASVTRTSDKLTWAATATQWSGRSHKTVTRAGVRVGVFHQPTSRSSWAFVKSVRTSSTGKATVSIDSPESGNYRLVIGETRTVWAAYSRTIKGRI